MQIQKCRYRRKFSRILNLHRFFCLYNNVVPGRERKLYKERKVAQEIYCLERYLRALLLYSDQYSFPLEIIKGESPDFQLKSTMGNVGIEITAATEADYNKFLSKNSIEGESDEAIMYSEDGYAGNSFEQQCAGAIISCINKKAAKLPNYRGNNPDITRYELLIYVNMDLVPDLGILLQFLQGNIPQNHGFYHISVISNSLNTNKECLLYAINTDTVRLFETGSITTLPSMLGL